MITDAPLGLFLAIIAYLMCSFLWLHRVTSPNRSLGRAVPGLVLWLSVGAALPFGLAATNAPPAAQFLVFTPFLVCCIWAGFSPYGTRIASAPLWALTGIHAFRVPLEIVLDIWAHAGAVPVQMTYRGANFDILTGIAAVVLGVWMYQRPAPRWLVAGFNLFGLGMLINILIIVNRSSPTVVRSLLGGYESGPDMLPAFSFPAVWIATVALMPALALHLAVLRGVWRGRVDQPDG
jgi:hypothetical protein